ncbi:MRPL16 [Cordylochernes scorpioides]|uniref:Large ribosomal subunit protein uL16m n=1 Tax=Cordylochernes scorpioides TaxID=51811 RepID=A0ABY6LFG1_9ARAC|nr:MRPL16 [Cordylochernes scorpioides]
MGWFFTMMNARCPLRYCRGNCIMVLNGILWVSLVEDAEVGFTSRASLNGSLKLLNIIFFNPQVLKSCNVSRYMKTVPPPPRTIYLIKERLLPPMDKEPTAMPNDVKPPKLSKHLEYVFGPELVHNKLIHEQFGIMALEGGYLNHEHLVKLQNRINSSINPEKMFAIWRVDAPWMPRYKRGPGKKMGGGKGDIHHYATPVKAGRIIVEVGGDIDYAQAKSFLDTEAKTLPIQAMMVSPNILHKIDLEFQDIQNSNINPFNLERCVKYRMLLFSEHNPRKNLEKWYGVY